MLVVACSQSSMAQRDTTNRQTIEITSSYKPVLRDPVKINLYASPLDKSAQPVRLTYNIPPHNLFFAYKPVPLDPLVLLPDTSLQLGERNQLKLGYGSFKTPFVAGAFSLGDGKNSLLNLYGNYVSSRGNIKHQDFSELNIKGAGSLFSEKNETYAWAGFAQHEYHQYGYNHDVFDFDKTTLRRSFQDFSAGAGYRNTAVNDLNFIYNPHAEFHAFSRENKATETTLMLNIPVEKKFSENVAVKVNVISNFNHYKVKDSTNFITNNLFQLAPELVYFSEIFTLHAGATPAWNNKEAVLLPNVYGELQLQNKVLMIQGGWIGKYTPNSYRTLSAMNPYMSDPTFLKNTKETEFYGGIKASIDQHFNVNARASVISYTDYPLFINDPSDQKKFILINERKLNNFQIHGDVSYVSQDRFSLTGGLDLNSYGGLKDNEKAWHLFPLKLTGSLRWNVLEQLLIKSDLLAFSGSKALLGDGSVKNLKGGTDLSVGGEFKVTPKFSAWVDLNNVLNSNYQRWNNYEVYGLNVIGGILIHF